MQFYVHIISYKMIRSPYFSLLTNINLYQYLRLAKIVVKNHGLTGRGGERGCSPPPPNFGQLRVFGQQEKIWAKPAFKDVSMFFY